MSAGWGLFISMVISGLASYKVRSANGKARKRKSRRLFRRERRKFFPEFFFSFPVPEQKDTLYGLIECNA